MSPEQRKEASELLLHKRGIRLNLQLHVIESEDEVTLRSVQELGDRLLALWLVSQSAQRADTTFARRYVAQHQLTSVLSKQEQAFLACETVSDEQAKQFGARPEALYFLAWCAGLIEKISIPTKASNLKSLLPLFTIEDEAVNIAPRLLAAIQCRRKSQIMDWSDLLYRLHWAVQHAHLTGRPTPASLNDVAVREWHQAVNWMCRYEDEDDWDEVSTET
jgi:hypothetical protein